MKVTAGGCIKKLFFSATSKYKATFVLQSYYLREACIPCLEIRLGIEQLSIKMCLSVHLGVHSCGHIYIYRYLLLYIDMYTWSLQSTYLLAVGQIISNYIICQEMTSNSINSDLPSNKNRLRRVPSGSLVYISIDIDGLDPSIAPGTGTPSHGGFLYYEVKDMGRWGNWTIPQPIAWCVRKNHGMLNIPCILGRLGRPTWFHETVDRNKGTTPWGGRGFEKSLWSWNVWSSAT